MILLSIALSVWPGVLLRKASECESVGSTSMAGSVVTGSLRSSQGHMRLCSGGLSTSDARPAVTGEQCCSRATMGGFVCGGAPLRSSASEAEYGSVARLRRRLARAVASVEVFEVVLRADSLLSRSLRPEGGGGASLGLRLSDCGKESATTS